MKKFLRRARTPILSVLLAAVLLLCAVAAYPALAPRPDAAMHGYEGVLRVWQIDSFEGGTGSRTAFLNSAARIYERENEGVLLLVTAHTPASAANAAAEGDYPDLLSFGTGTDFVADAARPLQNASSSGGSIGGETYAVPWCRGQYFLFSAEGDFSDVGADNTVLSQGRGALPAVAAWAEGLRGAFRTEESVRAYVNFLQGKYKYLLGTQRDVYRFQARGAEVTAKPLTAFCDLWQYIAVCTADPERYAAAAKFVSLLLSDTVQGMLPRIGMLPVGGEVYGADNAAMYAAQKEVPEKTVSAFLTGKTVGELRAAGEAAINGDEIGAKNLEKFIMETL